MEDSYGQAITVYQWIGLRKHLQLKPGFCSHVNCPFNQSIDSMINHAILPGFEGIITGKHPQLLNIIKSFLQIDAQSTKTMGMLVCDQSL